MRIKKIQMICNNPRLLQAFYTRQLGLPLLKSHEQGFSVQAGDTEITFVETNYSKDTAYHIAFNITPALLEATVPFLQEQQVPLIYKDGHAVVDFPDWNAKSVYFYDTEENILEFIARYNLPVRTTDKVFSADHILQVSEIGVPVDDTAAFIKTLRSHAGLAVWKDYGEQFKAVGGEDGLLIVVTKGRNWFPTTDHPNSFLPLRVALQHAGSTLHYNSGLYTFEFV